MNRYEREAKEQRKDHIDKHSEETMDELRLANKIKQEYSKEEDYGL